MLKKNEREKKKKNVKRDKRRDKEKEKNKKSSKKGVKIPALSIIDNVVFSKKEAWAYYKIGSVPYDFLTNSGRLALSNSIMTAFSGLVQKTGKVVDVQIIVTNTPFNVDSWEDQMYRINEEWNGKGNTLKTFDEFMENQTKVLKSKNYKKKVVYLGIKLYNRGSFSMDDFNILDFGFKEAFEAFKKSVSSLLDVPSEEISANERQRAKKDEFETNRTVKNSSLRGTRVSSEELLLLMKKTLYPAMPAPYLEVNHDERVGLNDIVMETGCIIEDKRRYLKIRQMVGEKERTGYRATLSFAKFPSDSMMEPGGIEPFMYLPTMLGLAFTMTSRLSLIPVEKMKKDLQKKKLESKDELNNLASSGQDVTSSIIETQRSIDELDYELNNDNMPWVSGHYRMTIETPTYELLAEIIQEIKQEYAKTDTVLVWTTGDQLDLLLEEMPGGKLEMSDFAQLTNLAMIAVSGFSYGGQVGDPIDEKTVFRGGGK